MERALLRSHNPGPEGQIPIRTRSQTKTLDCHSGRDSQTVTTGTVAVLAGGHDNIYPPQHVPLVEALIENGAAVSEIPLGYGPRGSDVPRRNRLISGLALGCHHGRGGAKVGVPHHAATRTRPEPGGLRGAGPPLDPRAAGTNALLKLGAIMVTEAEDVLAVLRPIIGRCIEQWLQIEDGVPLPSRRQILVPGSWR